MNDTLFIKQNHCPPIPILEIKLIFLIYNKKMIANKNSSWIKMLLRCRMEIAMKSQNTELPCELVRLCSFTSLPRLIQQPCYIRRLLPRRKWSQVTTVCCIQFALFLKSEHTMQVLIISGDGHFIRETVLVLQRWLFSSLSLQGHSSIWRHANEMYGLGDTSQEQFSEFPC